MRGSPTLWRNRLLEEAYEQRTPIIYFLGVEPALYEPIVPAFIYSFDPIGRNCLVGPGDLRNTVEQVIDQRPFDSASERRYYMRETQQRAHQSIFRAAVLHAYRHRCAVTGLTVPRLLDAAHIVEDRHETLGQPVVPNGLPLSKIHHAAFDANLISIDPDYQIHISERLLDENDGPLLELLKQADGNRIYLPRQNPHDRPCAHPDGMKQTDAASARPLPVRSCNVEFENRVRSPYLGISGRLRAINRGCPDRRGVSTFGERTSHGGRSWQLSV
jgi:putative restriction endonuclease